MKIHYLSVHSHSFTEVPYGDVLVISLTHPPVSAPESTQSSSAELFSISEVNFCYLHYSQVRGKQTPQRGELGV